MTAPTKTTTERAQEKRERAKLEFETARYKRATRLMKWDATEPNRLREQPRTEKKDEGGIYDITKRLKGCNLGRDLERNYSPAKSMLHQIKVNVVGSLGKLRINLDGDEGTEGTEWFNEVWSKDPDFRTDTDWSTELQNILGSEIREGDMLTVFDDDLIEDSGKLMTWEADQVVPVSDEVLKAKGYGEGFVQDNGIIRDSWGREVAYCATGKRGIKLIDDPAQVTIWKRGQARLVRNPWRLNQGRGTPSLLTPSTNFIDLYEILSCELMTSKRAAKQYAFVKRADAVTDWDDPGSGPEWLPENDGQTAAEVDAEGANQTTKTARNYEKLDSFTGGLMDYMDPHDDVQFPDVTRPNKDLAGFLEAVIGYGGSAMGLARAYTILRADSSYTSFRGDMILTWVTFTWLQKHLERSIADWTAIKALTWAQRKNDIARLPDGWQRRLSWSWPTMPEVDELDAQNAIAAALKNGTTDWSKLLGPDWERKLKALGEQANVIRDLELPLSFFEGKSGGSVNPKKDNGTGGGSNE
tara:strand:+ start:2746 stop:4323 length:1578 start_codon:yes stop_codon:yes gene_type:complete